MKNYQCTKCGTLLQSDRRPSSFDCRAGGMHNWQDLGDVGAENFQCEKCGLHVESHRRPSSFGCTKGGMHQW